MRPRAKIVECRAGRGNIRAVRQLCRRYTRLVSQGEAAKGSQTVKAATTIVADISLEAQCRILFPPLDWNTDTAAEGLTSQICRLTTFRDRLNNRW
jgi:hypothetical protein